MVPLEPSSLSFCTETPDDCLILLLFEPHNLQERGSGQSRAHIPFRNSMLTTALRDSLGGNCRTVMVANVAATADQAKETVSTCRFAKRVAMISNSVSFWP